MRACPPNTCVRMSRMCVLRAYERGVARATTHTHVSPSAPARNWLYFGTKYVPQREDPPPFPSPLLAGSQRYLDHADFSRGVGQKNYGKKSYHRNYRLRRVRVSPEQALGTLATDTAITNDMAPAADGAYRCISVNGVWSIAGLTAGEGPITIGLVHGDYSLAELKECLEQAGSISVGNLVAQEVANRKVRVVGTILSQEPILNEGKPMKTRLNWLIPIGKTVKFFAFNESTATLTTGASLHFTGDLWVKDGL